MSDLAELIFGEKRHFSFRGKKRSNTKLNETRSAPTTPHTVWKIPTNGSAVSLGVRREDGLGLSAMTPVTANRAPNPFDYSQSPKSSFDSLRPPYSANPHQTQHQHQNQHQAAAVAVPGGHDDKRPSLPGLSDSGSNSSTESLRPVTPVILSTSAPTSTAAPAPAPAPAPAVSAAALSSALGLTSVSASVSSRYRPPTSHEAHDSKKSGDSIFTDTLPQRPSTAPATAKPAQLAQPARPIDGERERERDIIGRQPITAENAYISRRRPSAAAATMGNRHLSPVEEQSEAANWPSLPPHPDHPTNPNRNNSTGPANLTNPLTGNSSSPINSLHPTTSPNSLNSPNSINATNTNDGIGIQTSTTTSISTASSQIGASARERPWDSHVHTIDYERYDRTIPVSAVPPPYSLEPPSKSFEDPLLRSASPGYSSRALPSVPAAPLPPPNVTSLHTIPSIPAISSVPSVPPVALAQTKSKSAYPKPPVTYSNAPHFTPPIQHVQDAKTPLDLPIQSVKPMKPMQSMHSIQSVQDDFDFPSPPPTDRFNSLPGRRKADSMGDWSKFWAPKRQTISAAMQQPEYVSFLDMH